MEEELKVAEQILEKHPKHESSIIQVLLDVQDELYYLPKDVAKFRKSICLPRG